MSANRKVYSLCAFLVVALVLVAGGLHYDHTRTEERAAGLDNTTVEPSYLGPPLVPAVWPGDAPLFVTFLGDSLTAGYNASTPELGYKNVLLGKLAAVGPVAQSGVAIPGGRLQRVADIAPDVGPANRLVIVELGTNDAADPPTPIEEFRAQYRNLLTETKSTASNAPIICLGTWLGSNSEGVRTGTELDSAIYAECRAQGGTYLRLDSLFEPAVNRGPAGRPSVGDDGLSDNFHPNDAGHQQIAEQIFRRLDLRPGPVSG